MFEFLFGDSLICEYVKEGNYGEVSGTAVIKTDDGFESRKISYKDGDDIEDVYNSVLNTHDSEEDAIEDAEKYFNEYYR